jgi:CRISPR-associated protein Cst2
MSKAIVIGYLAKVSAANVNASHTEGNVVVAKKVTLPDGSTIPYISGQAVRRMLRDRLEELGYPLSEPFARVEGQEVTPPVRPWEFVDEDLFGYLDPSGGRRRTSPVRVSAAVGLFPFQGDRDLGTRSFERFGQAMAAGGNMFETELYANLFKGTVLVELDRVGVFRPLEIGEDAERALAADERRKRLQTLFEALNLLWGGGRTARMLADLSPKFSCLRAASGQASSVPGGTDCPLRRRQVRAGAGAAQKRPGQVPKLPRTDALWAGAGHLRQRRRDPFGALAVRGSARRP